MSTPTMNEEEHGLYGVFHRIVLQMIIARNVITKKELEKEIFPNLNEQYQCELSVGSVIGKINNKLRILGFKISETSCDDGEIYFCYVNTVVDPIANKSSLPIAYLQELRSAIERINEDEFIDPVALCQVGDSVILKYLFDNHWLCRYPSENGVTVIGGPHLMCEMSNWLINEVNVRECLVCMDPVVGGLPCPHLCGAILHHGCAYRTLLSMESNDDNVDKGICPGCKEKWAVDVGCLLQNGRVYQRDRNLGSSTRSIPQKIVD